ncbi:AT-rich interactive domain-containing protein 1-like isoform X2 [Solanum dulcamara]|uniref:AT-rich interactive domain-containing protein 1-like isoform X2 n=1 Tax=Solanum dulcamara TaxID=45834 RepID=UPI002485DB2F|nr:AT-rich interactive domain-containing protein 1-like isoform X2 [Solanum dulcamara]XP_055817250.1 AT-rich interactive domain-containing protein 1-like isoform X2 [Solanum dulcamara]
MAGWSKRVDGSGLESFRPFPPMLGDGKTVDLCKLYLVVRETGGYDRVCTSGSWGVVAEECGFDSTSGLALKLVYVKYLDALNKAMVKLELPDNEKSEVKKSALGFSAVRMDLELDLKEVLMKISDERKKDEEYGKMEFDPATDGRLSNGIEVQDFVGLIRYSENFVEKRSLDDSVCDVKRIDEKFSSVYSEKDSKFMNQNKDYQIDTNDIRPMKLSGDEEDCIIRKRKNSDGKMSVGYDEEHLKIDDGNGDDQGGTDDIGLTKFSGDEEDGIARKRKRESYLDMLKWITELAKDPCDPAIGHLPEKSKWKSYGNEVVWKKILLLRDEMLLERNVDTSTQYSIWQQKQKMHPSMYDDNSGSERLRCSQRVLSAKDSLKNSGSHIDGTLVDGPTDSSAESGVWWNRRRKKIASIGSEFQADIPEWKKDYESDSKWLGTGIWPLDKNEQRRILIERDPTGKGREDTCGCEYSGSYDCIRFHLSEKRRKLKLELGSAFYHWKFDYMGEKVALSWTTKDEQNFQDIAKSSSLSEDESFSYWPELFKFFPHKSRESLVSYYFNVFNLRRIGQQNSMNTSDVDSDDDESGYGPRSICFGRDPKFAIFCSPKKARLDPR